MSERDPIRVYVTHSFEPADDYLRVFEYLESSRNFFYRNCSNVEKAPAQPGVEPMREALRGQMQDAEVVVALTSLFRSHASLLTFQLHFAKAKDKPVLLLPQFGSEPVRSKEFDGLVDEYVGWDERALVDAIRRQARHEQTMRWETIEFKLD